MTTARAMKGEAAPPAATEERDPTLWNEDLAPTPPEKRTWGTLHVASLWVGMAVCIPTYLLAGYLVDAGMSATQAIVTIALGNVIVLAPMILNAHPGPKYGIPFPVFARASFGVLGANVPAIARALVACGWFGIQTWIGGKSLFVILVRTGVVGGAAPLPVLGISGAELLCFFAFWGLNVYFIWRGMESIKWLETLAAPLLLVGGVALLFWARSRAGGFGAIMAKPGLEGAAFWKVFVPSLTAMVGFWATLALNIPDFSRFCRDQRSQVVGQTLGLPTTMTLFSFIGIAVTSATPAIFGVAKPISDPNLVVGRLDSLAAVVVGLAGIAIATLSTNIAANVVSPANDFSNVAPGKISYRMGGYITAAIGVAMFPWKLENKIDGWLIAYGALLGPIAGIMVFDYWVVRRRQLVVGDLYRRGGIYEFQGGTNRIAMLALAAGVAVNVPGFLASVGVWSSAPELFKQLYTYAWFLGFFLAGILYTLAMGRPAAPGVIGNLGASPSAAGSPASKEIA